MITTITVTGTIEADTVIPIMMSITGMKTIITIMRRLQRNLEGEAAGNHNRWVAYEIYYTVFYCSYYFLINAVVWLWHSVG